MSLGIGFDVDPAEARAHFQGKGLAPSFHYSDVWGREHQRQFTVAKMLDTSLLEVVKGSLQKAMDEGQTYEDFRKHVEPILRDAGWWGAQWMEDPETGKKVRVQLGSDRRLRLIFRQAMLAAYNAGREQRQREMQDRRPFWRYESVRDDRTRKEHLAWDGIILPASHPWWDTHYPPNGYLCRCTVTSLSEATATRLGGVSDHIPGEDERRPWKNPRTDKEVSVPWGQDPGFDHSPMDPARVGEAWAEQMARQMDAGQADATPGRLPVQAVESLLRGGAFAEFFANPSPGQDFLVGAMPKAVREPLGATGPGVFLSGETLEKNKRHHPEVTQDDYARLPGLLAEPALAIQDGELTAVVVRRDGEWWLAALKTTRTGARNFLTSFRRTNENDVKRMLKRGALLLGEAS